MHRNILKALLIVPLFGFGGFLFPSNSAQDANEAERLLQKAIMLEDVDGNLQAAIEQYKNIIGENGGNRPVAAKALLRLAGCYEKLGQKEAQKTYEQLIREYPDQIDLVKIARAKLTVLQKGNTNLTVRLVWEGSEVELMGEPSPDGRYICYTDWDTGDLAIHDLTTGENRRLSGQKEWDDSFAEKCRWSPDGKTIAYTWYDQGDTWNVRVVGIDGTKPRIISRNVFVEDWSPDGKQLLVRGRSEEGFVSLVSVSDGSVRHLLKMGRTDVERDYMQFSPDGKYIAYDQQNESTSRGIAFPTEKDIYLLSADGKTQIPLIKNPANDYLLGWTPDTGDILFASDRSGAVDAWIQPVKNGKPAGEARIVRKDIGRISPLGLTRDGAFFYGHGKDLRSIYIASIDRKPEAMAATYKKLELPFEGRNSRAEFSPDGKRVAFVRVSSRSGTGPRAITNNSLCIHDLETGEEKTFPLNLGAGTLRWAPDGSAILFSGAHEGRVSAFSFDIWTGDTKDIFPSDKNKGELVYLSPDWSPDGNSIYCVRLTRGGGYNFQFKIIEKNLQTGKMDVVYEVDSKQMFLSMISLSPDGTRLAAMERRMPRGNESTTEWTLKIISTKDGKAREACRFFSVTNDSLFPRWSRDGQYIFFPGPRPGKEVTWDIWYVPVKGGDPKGLGLSLQRIEDISPHPDGFRFAFSSLGPTVHGPEVWVMENFLTQ
jgi:Tol biopolymer transport system component